MVPELGSSGDLQPGLTVDKRSGKAKMGESGASVQCFPMLGFGGTKKGR